MLGRMRRIRTQEKPAGPLSPKTALETTQAGFPWLQRVSVFCGAWRCVLQISQTLLLRKQEATETRSRPPPAAAAEAFWWRSVRSVCVRSVLKV